MVEILKPETEEQLIDVVQWAVNAKTPLKVQGLGSKASLGRFVESTHLLDLSAMSGITHYEPSELVLSAKAGTPLLDIQETLAANNQSLAFEPVNLNGLFGQDYTAGTLSGTIGGLVAAGFAGPRRSRQGSVRDHVLGFRAISGRGELFKSGGKVMKNVTGFDLSKLMAGSFGTLAVMSDVTLKVLPTPEKSRTVLIFGLDDASAMKAMAEALNSPYEVSSAAHLPKNISSLSSVDMVQGAGASVTAIRVEGPDPSVVARCDALKKSHGKFGEVEELHSSRSAKFWAEVCDVQYFSKSQENQVWRLSVPPASGADVVGRIKQSCNADVYYDWGGGLIWVSLSAAADANHSHIREAFASCGGHATLVRASDDVRAFVPVFQPQATPLAALSGRVKNGFDPHCILNPNRMYSEF